MKVAGSGSREPSPRYSKRRHRSEYEPALGPFSVTVVISLTLVLLTAVIVVARVTAPSDGSVVQLSNSIWEGDRMTVNFVLDETTGLQAHDVITAMDGRPLSAGPHTRELVKGDLITYSIIRDGAAHEVSLRLRDFPVGGFLIIVWPSLVTLAALLAVAMFVYRRRPGDPAARVLILVATLVMCGTVSWLLGVQAFRLAAVGPSSTEVLGEIALALVWGALLHFTLVAPGVRVAATRPRIVAAYCAPLALHAVYIAVALPSARTQLEAVGRLAQVSLLPSSVLPVATALLLLLGYRSTAEAEARARMRWLLLTVVVAGCCFFFMWTVPNALGWPLPAEHLVPLVILPPTLALGAAILRYRLFDIEVILRRSLVYGALTVSVIAVSLVAAWLLGGLPGSTPGVVAVVTGALVAFIAPPLRSNLLHRVGRLIFGERDDPFEVISRLGRINTAADPQSVLNDVAETLAQSLRLSFVGIELRSMGSQFAIEANFGHSRGQSMILRLDGPGVSGSVVLAVSPGHEPFGPADRRLLDALAHQVSGAAATILLTAELQYSRAQIVAAREDERRHLHHRLHDGLGPELVAGVMHLEYIKSVLRPDPELALSLIEAQIIKNRELIQDVRGLVYNLRPPALDQLGLTAAIRARAEYLARPGGANAGGMHLEVVEDQSMDGLPAAVEVAAFWIVVEAVSNAVRHSGAKHCRIWLTRNRDLHLQVEDDGHGWPDQWLPGGGMASMRERAEELGGTCDVRRGDTGGIVVEARLPIREWTGLR
jgi:two-component system NarL family sensor kinase